jgi:hypothetical protein
MRLGAERNGMLTPVNKVTTVTIGRSTNVRRSMVQTKNSFADALPQ